MAQVTINIAKDFTRSPGARYYDDGPYSGQEFREKILEKHFEPGDETKVEINLDGTDGYPTSFLEESFGGLVRKYGEARVRQKVRFVSKEDTLVLVEIEGYIRDAAER